MTEQLVTHLADVIRRYNQKPYANGGRRPGGMKILQKESRRKVPATWEERSTVPEQVALILLGIQFDKKKAVASAFEAAEEVARQLSLRLTWKEDFELGAFLISCLTKVGYYDLKDMYSHGDRIEYGLYAKKKAVRAFPEQDRNTRTEPFPEWKGPVDEEGRWLVKPSWPQQKKTYWKPEKRYFSGSSKSTAGKILDIEAILDMNPTWITAVHKLESNAYRINQNLLEVVNAIAEDTERAPQKTNPVLEKELVRLEQEYSQKRRGNAVLDGKVEFNWNELEPENRCLKHLDLLHKKQKKQDRGREKKNLKPYPEGDGKRHITAEQDAVRKEYWGRRYANQNARTALETKYNDFHKTVIHCNEVLRDKAFYQRIFLDYRGRMYLSKSVVNYQGGDLQRGLIDFAFGKKVRKQDLKHLYIRLGDLHGIKGDNGAKEIGARLKNKKFLAWGNNPVETYDQWKNVGDKWQFIRACIELSELEKNPNHKSTLICEIDQSTSCLQHIALIEGDEKLARQVNLTKHYNDIYQEIADEIEDLADLRSDHRRKVVKIALLAWTYGGNAWTACQDYHKSDMPYLVEMKAGDRLRIANKVVKAIEDALPSAKQYRDEWRGEIDKRWEKKGERNMVFETASKFEVHTYKQETDERRQYVWQKKNPHAGRDDQVKLTAYEPNSAADKEKLKKAMAPNFVHSIDASVIHLLLEGVTENVSVVAVHDAVGTFLRDIDYVREEFRMSFYRAYKYENHPIQLLNEDPFEAPDDPEKLEIMGNILIQARKSPHMI